jgi:hypothetical protein
LVPPLFLHCTMTLHNIFSSPATPTKPRMLPTILKSQLPSPSASYRQSSLLPIVPPKGLSSPTTQNNPNPNISSMLPMHQSSTMMTVTNSLAKSHYHSTQNSTRWVTYTKKTGSKALLKRSTCAVGLYLQPIESLIFG